MRVKNLLLRFLATAEWSLVGSGGAIAVATFFAATSHTVLSAMVLIAALFIVYIRESEERLSYRRLFLLFSIILFLWCFFEANSVFSAIFIALLAGIIIYVWLALTRLLIHKKQQTELNLFVLFFYFSFLFAFVGGGIIRGIVAASIIIFLFYETNMSERISWKKRALLFSWAIGLFFFEAFLIIKGFSLGAVMSAGVLTVMGLTMRNLMLAHFSGDLLYKRILEQGVVCLSLILIFFATARWIF